MRGFVMRGLDCLFKLPRCLAVGVAVFISLALVASVSSVELRPTKVEAVVPASANENDQGPSLTGPQQRPAEKQETAKPTPEKTTDKPEPRMARGKSPSKSSNNASGGAKKPLAERIPSNENVGPKKTAPNTGAPKKEDVEVFIDQVLTLTFPKPDAEGNTPKTKGNPPSPPANNDGEKSDPKSKTQPRAIDDANQNDEPEADDQDSADEDNADEDNADEDSADEMTEEDCSTEETDQSDAVPDEGDEDEDPLATKDEDERTDAIGDITDDYGLPYSGKMDEVEGDPIPAPKNKEPGRLPVDPKLPAIPAPKQPAPRMTAESLARRNRIRDVLAYHFERNEKAVDRTPWGLMHAMIGYGVDASILDSAGRKQNAIGYLCYNYSGKGQRLFKLDNGKLVAEVGPGIQGHPGQFLAMLAQSRVDLTYPIRVEGRQFRVQDLLEYEMRTCKPRTELTFKLMAFAHYLPSDASWRDDRGELWTIPRLIEEELKQPIIGAACGGNHRLNGFSYAVNHRAKQGRPIDGQFARADKFTRDYRDYLFTLQNPDGSFSTQWYRHRAAAPDLGRRLQTTGHMLEWLVYSCPDSQLNDPRLLRAVDYLTQLLAEGKGTKWEIGPLGHGLHALAIYDERVYGGRPGTRAVMLSREVRARENAERIR